MTTETYKRAWEALCIANGWNEHRIHRSFAAIPYGVLRTMRDGFICFDLVPQEVPGAKDESPRVLITVMMPSDMSGFRAFLCHEGIYRPFHEPVQIPIMYGFKAQTNQLLSVVSGLEYVHRISGVQCLPAYPKGLTPPA